MFQFPSEQVLPIALRLGTSLWIKCKLSLREVWLRCCRMHRSSECEWGTMMRRFTVVFILLLAVLDSTLCAVEDSRRDSYLLYSDFVGLFPGAEENVRHDGACVLMQQNGCRIIAVVCSDVPMHIPLIFVNAETADKASRMARWIAGKIRCKHAIRPFERRAPWVAIICPCRNESQRYTPNVLCTPNSLLLPSSEEKARFIGWQGKSLCVRVNYEPELSQRRKVGTIEIVSDISRDNCACVEFRFTKGNFNDDDMLEFICIRTSNVFSYTSTKRDSRLRELKKQFPGYSILHHPLGSEFCVIRKKKICFAGSADDIAAYISPRRKIANFDFSQNDEVRDENDTETVKQPQNNEKTLASGQQTSVEATKTPKSHGDEDDGDGELLTPPSPSAQTNVQVNKRAEPPPSTVPEAINRYVQYLNTL